MSADFIDTNVLLYLLSADADKAAKAEALLRQGGMASVQVLNEFAHVARRKAKLSWPETRAVLADLEQLLTIQPLTIEVHRSGIALAERYGLSVYDGMIVAAARHFGCGTLWSEDMQHGLVVENALRILNPFAAA